MFRPTLTPLIAESAHVYINESNAVSSFLKTAQNPQNHPALFALLRPFWKKTTFAHSTGNLHGDTDMDWKIILGRDGFFVETIEEKPRVVIACSMPSFFPTGYNLYGTSFVFPMRNVCWDLEASRFELIISNNALLAIFERIPLYDLLKSVQFVNKRWNIACKNNLLWNPVLETMNKAGILQEKWKRPTAIETFRLHSLCDWKPNKNLCYRLKPIHWTDSSFSLAYLQIMWPLICAKYRRESRRVGFDTFSIEENKPPEKKRSRFERKETIWTLRTHSQNQEFKVIQVVESSRSDGFGHAIYSLSPRQNSEVSPNGFLRLFWEPLLLDFLNGQGQ